MLFRRFLHHRWKIEKQDAKPLRLIFLDHRLKMSFLHCFNAGYLTSLNWQWFVDSHYYILSN